MLTEIMLSVVTTYLSCRGPVGSIVGLLRLAYSLSSVTELEWCRQN